ncbi:glycosyltransferase family 4 protein [Marinobacter sp.]|uniref:glycosyltransferase family 4 protein n=1 Tax=Marinobacter sp. TaxID=50741 RepID=UPI001B4B3B63|nr:glycosyltransferase family 4 protein [Marinobacter sp.]MBQ0831296.1 glycosyltransferase family 4 protein [Marinobacter sp.]
MKILLISNMYPSGGSPFYGIFVKNFESQMIDKGVMVESVVIRGRSNSIFRKVLQYFIFMFSVIRAVFNNNFDIIYVHYAKHSLIPLALISRFIKKPVVINAHGDDITESSLLLRFVSDLIVGSDLLVVPSEYFRDIASKRFNHDNVFVSPSAGVDTKQFSPVLKSTNHDIFTIGYVSRVDPGKGWDVLLNACVLLKNGSVNFRVHIIGAGNDEQRLLDKITDLGLEDVVFYFGPKPHNSLQEYFNEMDLFVFPTMLHESLGLVGLEAMACAVPVVGSNIGGLPSYIKDSVNGKLFTPGDFRQLAETIESFTDMDKNLLSSFKASARDTAELYDSDIVTQNLLVKLNEVIG